MDPRPHLLIDAAYRRPTHRRPVWMMRQAGRHLPEYRKIRERHGFLEMCKTPDLAVEISLQPYRRYKVDGVIVFSDILFIPEAMGPALDFTPGPVFERTIRTSADIDGLRVPDDPHEHCGFIFDALDQLRRELHDEVPLLGFAGAPFTLACYMIEGSHSHSLQYAKSMLFQQPAELHRLMEKIADALIPYLQAQIDAGAQALQLFDSYGGMLSPADWRAFSLPWIRRVIDAVRQPGVPMILFVKHCAPHLEAMADSGADVVSVDWMVDIAEARARIGHRVALQGNLDPMALTGSPESIADHVRDVLDRFGPHHGLIGNLGHGVLPFLEPEGVSAFVRRFKELSRGYASPDDSGA